MKELEIKRLNIYPIKSCGGTKIGSVTVQKNGFKFDRFFAVINSKNQILTAREKPKLLNISSGISNDKLIISTYGTTPITIDLNKTLTDKIDVKIFRDYANAKIVGQQADDWLSHTLQEKCRLVSINSELLRKMKSKYNGKEDDFISFSDVAPIHLISEESLKDLNSKLERPVTIDNFRSNIVVAGSPAYEEDNWSSIKIGNCEFEVSLGTSRCILTTIDPITTKFDSETEPLKTLSKYRKVGKDINFGIYLKPKKMGVINLTDKIKITGNTE